jgi:hypothetical protein
MDANSGLVQAVIDNWTHQNIVTVNDFKGVSCAYIPETERVVLTIHLHTFDIKKQIGLHVLIQK